MRILYVLGGIFLFICATLLSIHVGRYLAWDERKKDGEVYILTPPCPTKTGYFSPYFVVPKNTRDPWQYVMGEPLRKVFGGYIVRTDDFILQCDNTPFIAMTELVCRIASEDIAKTYLRVPVVPLVDPTFISLCRTHEVLVLGIDSFGHF